MRFLLAALLLVDAYLGHEAYLGTIGVSERFAAAHALVIAGAIALVAILVTFRPTRLPLALARGMAVVAAAVAILVWMVGVAFSGIGGGSPDAAAEQRWHMFAAGTVALQVAIFVVSHRIERPSLGRTILSAAGGTAAVYLGGILVFAAVQVLAPFVDYAITAPRFDADSVMKASVARIQSCAWQYIARDPARGFPRDLRAMGPPPEGSGCLDAALASGRTGRVQVAYRPAASDATGQVRDFTVLAEAASGAHGESRQAFGDSAGFLRSGFAAPYPDTLPIVGGDLRRVAVVRACAEVFRQRHPEQGYPATLADFLRLEEEVGERGAALVGCNPFSVPVNDPKRYVYAFRFTYSTTGARPVTDYVIELRPTTYALHGIRSYRTTARGPVHMTREDRSAGDADPIVPECAYELGEYTCAPLPGGVAPEVTLDAPATAVRDIPFRAGATDLRPNGTGAPYQSWIECDYRSGFSPDPSPKPADWSFALDRSCTITAARHRADYGDDRAWLRVWVRDRAGNVVILKDTVHLVRGPTPPP